MTSRTNHLADVASPYLRQHADNPVDWYPWGPEALRRAVAEDKPILLSVGYAACHWCHVMAHESFEDDAIAAVVNEHLIAIKVDREERPDLDTLYMTAVQAFTGGHGGWPMTLFLTPDGRPFLGGTYFPPAPRHGMPSFGQLVERAIHVWQHDRERVLDVADRVAARQIAAEQIPELAGDPPEVDWLDQVLAQAVADVDDVHGGFGGAPKFPPHGTLAALLALHGRTGDPTALTLVTDTLEAMARGGMYDHLGGGFCRYSVDAEWRIPHFEKMLVDNAQLVPVYVDAWRHTSDPFLARIARETLDYVARDMTGPEGAFFASEDADSEGEEGTFYVWTPAQLREVLGDDADRAAELLQVTASGTFEHGTSVLRLDTPWERLPPGDQDLVDRALLALRTARDERERPGLDDKRITAWNAWMVRAFAVAGAAMEAPQYVERAAVAARFLLRHATVDGRLHRIWTPGRGAEVPAFLDDHAALLVALVDLWEATFDPAWVTEALRLADATFDLFWDEESGTCTFTGRDAEPLVATPRKLVGGAEPSGNGALAWGLARLAVLADRPDLGDRADRLLAAYAPWAHRVPRAIGLEAIAWGWRQGPTREVALVLPHDRALAEPMLRAIHRHADAFRVLAGAIDGAQPEAVPWLADKPAVDGRPTVYVCERFACQAPSTVPAEVEAALTPPGR